MTLWERKRLTTPHDANPTVSLFKFHTLIFMPCIRSIEWNFEFGQIQQLMAAMPCSYAKGRGEGRGVITMVTGSPVGVVTVHSLYGSWLRPSSTTNLIWEQNKQPIRIGSSKPNTEHKSWPTNLTILKKKIKFWFFNEYSQIKKAIKECET